MPELGHLIEHWGYVAVFVFIRFKTEDTGPRERSRRHERYVRAKERGREMEPDGVKLAPSILAADFARLGEQVGEAERAGADRIHVDVMDGHFVPNISMGAPIVKSLRRVTRLPLEIHLMISDPDCFLDEFVEAGSDSFLVHWEGNRNLHRTVQRIKALGKRAGVAINPATPAAVLEEILQDVEQVLIMTVNPGFGHQHFLPTTLQKIRRIRQRIEQRKSGCDVEVDGGIDADTAPLAVAAGANVLVAGTAIFGERGDVAAAMDRLRASITQLGKSTPPS
jgi:ribulose-phosphate 3-epimerase